MKKGSKGFTLVELVVVIAVLAILSGIALVRINSAREESAKNVCYANRTTIAKAYQFALVRNGSLTLKNFINSPEDYGTYYASKPLCPLGGIYTEHNGKIVCSQPGHEKGILAGEEITVVSNSLIQTLKTLEGLDRMQSGMDLNRDLKAALGGAFLPVEAELIELAFGDEYSGKQLSWRVDSGHSKTYTPVYFAADGERDHSNWQAYLLVIDGVLYKSTKVDPQKGKIIGANVAGFIGKHGDELAAAVAKQFVAVGKISY
ncbi:MAG: type II secretion system protein [Acidaminococcaceae bacterium]